MEEFEPPIEHVHETIHHQAHHTEQQWITWVAVSTAMLAGLAAVASLESGLFANMSIRETTLANDKWNYYQEKNLKATILQANADQLKAFGKEVPDATQKKIKEEQGKMAVAMKKANELDNDANEHFERHEHLAPAVTFCNIAIAVCAIAVLTKRRWFWGVGLLFGAIGTGFLIWGLTFPAGESPEAEGKEKQKTAAVTYMNAECRSTNV
jgi:hypothetical protein